ncbi:MAG: undecaprenyldiphospho-muramoylpentapeptide beta-N-acetylglucosaminyltransferase [Deltaproteobacteria bacterium]
MRIILTGGGTGGHIYPALAVAEGLRERIPGVELLYVGTAQGMESTIVPRIGIDFKTVDITGIDRSSMLKASRSVAKLPRSFFQGWEVVRSYRPDIILGTGGYVSFPVVLAGTIIPSCRTYIHEQNAVLGLANRNLARRVNGVLLTFAEAGAGLKAPMVKVTGLPVRKDIFITDRQRARAGLGIREDVFTLLVFGGSQGAASINRAMVEFMERCQDEDIQVIWMAGQANAAEIERTLRDRVDLDRMRCRLKLLPYIHNMPEVMAAVDLAVCRAGASTLSELAILGLPAILIPYPYAAENHQEHNARALAAKKAVEMIIDEFLNGDTLYKNVMELKRDPAQLGEMSTNLRRESHPNALNDILDIILQ